MLRVRARRRMRLKRNYKFVRYEDAARAPPPAAPPPAAPEPALQTRLSLAGARPAPPGGRTGCAVVALARGEPRPGFLGF